MARFLAAMIALVVGFGALVPPAIAYRCVAMKRVADRPCCKKQQQSAPDETAIGKPCCEAVDAPALQVRAAPKPEQPELAPAPCAGVVTFFALVRPLPAVLDSFLAKPSGNPLSLSTVLRI
jgi:hypothetical protein